MSPLRSVGARLAAALALVVAIALLAAWFVIAPSLERNLSRAKVEQLEVRAEILPEDFPEFFLEQPAVDPLALDDWVSENAFAANARVVVYTIRAREPVVNLMVEADSGQETSSGEIDRDVVASRAALYGRQTNGLMTREGNRYAEVAFPVRREGEVKAIVLLSASLEDTLASVHQVRRRLLIAGGLALGIAVLLGYAAASVFARRIRRLERAADRIAGGRLDEPVVDRGRDEVGQLAVAFERMRMQLSRLEHARREFIANASHELRTPIFSLGGFLELLANEELDEGTRREFLGTMQEQMQRLEKLATDLLDLSRLDAGQLQLDVESIDLERIAEALADEFAAVATGTGHSIEVDPGLVVPEAVGDETRALQIGRVLVENAIRHTPPGTAIRLGASTRDGVAVLSVADDGPGIAPEHAGQVFDRFFRIEGGQASGSGLGLAIACELAGAMEGRLELDSEPGHTVFRLELPAAAERGVVAASGIA
jgi:two-component system OmpR family sensor kinase